MTTIFRTIFGSRLYGTDNENSDYDVKSVYLPDLESCLVKTQNFTSRHREFVKDGIKYDCEDIPLQSFLKMASEGQTMAYDMLFSPIGMRKPVRVQGCFIDDREIEAVVEFIRKAASAEYDEAVMEEIERGGAQEQPEASAEPETDPMIPEAVRCVVEAGQASTSLLQRRLRLGYARAGRLVDEMEQMGVVGPHEGSKPRQVLLTWQQYLEMAQNRGWEN